MKFSVFNLLQWSVDRAQREIFGNVLDQLTLADSQGYHAAWLTEHHDSHDNLGPAVLLAAANLASRTRAIRIGTAITLLPFMHPLRIAEEIAMLDVLSKGRIELSVAPGLHDSELGHLDEQCQKRPRIFYEQIDLIQKAWSGEAFAHTGEFYNIDEVECYPGPIQRGGPSVQLAAYDRATIEWAAELRAPLFANPFSSETRLEQDRRLYVDTLARTGSETGDVEFSTPRLVYVGQSMRKAREEATPSLLGYIRSMSRRRSPLEGSNTLPRESDLFCREIYREIFPETFATDGIHPDTHPDKFLAYLIDECAIIGDESYCRDRIAALQETLHLSHLIAWQSFGELDHEQTLASQERLIDKVAPAFA